MLNQLFKLYKSIFISCFLNDVYSLWPNDDDTYFLWSTEEAYNNLSTLGILATGWPIWWWSWAEILVQKILNGEFSKVNKIVLVTNYSNWWVAKIVEKYKKDLMDISVNIELKVVKWFPKRWEDDEFTTENEKIIKDIYNKILTNYWLDYLFCSWWMKHILWLNPSISQNIHPGPTKEPYGWLHMYWDNVHKKVWEDYQKWIINQSCVTMHFVIPELDRGPITVQIPVDISKCTSADEVWKAVNKVEHEYQWIIYKLIFEWKISWSWIKWEAVQFNEKEIKKYEFPKWTVFGGEINLMEEYIV